MEQSLKQCKSRLARLAMVPTCVVFSMLGSGAAGFAQHGFDAGAVAGLAAPVRLDPCTVLSQHEAASLFGASLQPGREMAGSCAYFAGSGQEGVYLRLVGGETMPPGTVSQMYTGMLQHEHGPTEAYPGLGDQAHFIQVNGQGLRLQVLYHNRVVSLGAFGSHNSDVKAALVQAMRQVMQRL